MSLLGGSRGHLAAKASKCVKWIFWVAPGAILLPRQENGLRTLSVVIWAEASGCLSNSDLPPGWSLGLSFGRQGVKMLEMCFLGGSWGHLAAKASKCVKWVSWVAPGAIWLPRHQNGRRTPPVVIWAEACGCLSNSDLPPGWLLGPFGGHGL